MSTRGDSATHLQDCPLHLSHARHDQLPNREFHFILYRASGWKYVNKLFSQIWDQILAFRSFKKFNFGNPEKFNKEHQMILDALKSGDFNKTGQLIKVNLRSGLDQILSSANNMPNTS